MLLIWFGNNYFPQEPYSPVTSGKRYYLVLKPKIRRAVR